MSLGMNAIWYTQTIFKKSITKIKNYLINFLKKYKLC